MKKFSQVVFFHWNSQMYEFIKHCSIYKNGNAFTFIFPDVDIFIKFFARIQSMSVKDGTTYNWREDPEGNKIGDVGQNLTFKKK